MISIMKNMNLTQIAAACNGKIIGTYDSTQEIRGAVVDSRKVEKDFLFIATVGERVDGHDYINTSFEHGAFAALCEKLPEDAKGPCILVENSFIALKQIASYYRSQLDIKVVGITGSVGKTSTKEFISSVLEQKYQVLKTEGNFNNEIGLPLTILKIKEHHEIAVLEMGISDFGEMHRLSEIAKPDICVITNIGQCHLENLGSREGILKAKSEIFDFMNENGSICINGDDDMLSTLKEVKGITPIRFGLHQGNDAFANDLVTHGLFGSSCNIHINKKLQEYTKDHYNDSHEFILPAEVPLPGEHMILNALAATTVGILLHLTLDEIKDGISAVKPVGGRSNIIKKERITLIDDCYNANPVSMKAAIDLLAQADTRKVAILGDMFELGEREKELHYEVGNYAAEKVDVLICVGALSFHMHQGAIDASKASPSLNHIFYFETRDDMLSNIDHILKEQDTVLIKASHGMKFEDVVKYLESK